MKAANQFAMSPEAIDTTQTFEGYSEVAYPDPLTGGEPWTIGYGHTEDVCQGDTCTWDEAEDWFDDDLCWFEDLIRDNVTAPVTQGIFDAMVDIVYNVGPGSSTRDGIIRLMDGSPSTLLRKLNEGDYDGARAEYLKWVSPGSSVEEGLTRRREAFLVFWDLPDEDYDDAEDDMMTTEMAQLLIVVASTLAAILSAIVTALFMR